MNLPRSNPRIVCVHSSGNVTVPANCLVCIVTAGAVRRSSSTIGVGTSGGHMADTMMPRALHSMRNAVASPTTPNLDELKAA